jgi:hypothetical protein
MGHGHKVAIPHPHWHSRKSPAATLPPGSIKGAWLGFYVLALIQAHVMHETHGSTP